MTPTPEILAEFERLEKEATPGPWCAHPNGTSLWQGDEWTGNQLGARQRHICNATGTQEQHVVDLELLCEARNHLLALIAAARELRAAQETIKLAQAFLPKVEWVDWERGFAYCQSCDAYEPDGHKDGCAMVRILQYKTGDCTPGRELLATRRALRLAQARAMNNLRKVWTERYIRYGNIHNEDRLRRAARLCDHYAAKFERMAADCGEEMG